MSRAGGSSRAAAGAWMMYVTMRILAGPAAHIPLHTRNRSLEFLADFLWHAYPRVRGGLLHNLAHVMRANTSDPAVVGAARQAYGHLWLNYLDLLRAPTLSAAQLAAVVTIEGESILHQVRQDAGPAIVVTGHFAGGELALQAMAARGWTACVPAEHLQPEAFFHWVCNLRSRHGHRFVASDTQLKPLVQALRSGGGVVLTLDRDPTRSGWPVYLCGAVARVPVGAAILGQRYAARLIPLRSQRQADGRVLVTVGEPLPALVGEPASKNHGQALAALAGTLERLIIAAPEQWVLTTPLWDSLDDV